MKKMEYRTLIVGFGSVLCLLFAAATVRAQVVQTVTNTYAAKFICGVQPDGAITSMPDAQAGRYSTKINVHNNSGVTVRFRKKVIQLRGGQVPTEPSFRRIEALRPDWAMESTCRDIYSHLNIVIGPNQPPPYIEGFVILEVFFPQPSPVAIPRDPLDVAGIYTYRMEPFGTGGNSISVVVYPAKFNSYPLPPPPPPPPDDDTTTTSRLAPVTSKP
jgi:hypothetical protein